MYPNWHPTTAMMATVTTTTAVVTVAAATTNPLTFIHICFMCASLSLGYLSRSSLFSVVSAYLYVVYKWIHVCRNMSMPIPIVWYSSLHTRIHAHMHVPHSCVYMLHIGSTSSTERHSCHAHKKMCANKPPYKIQHRRECNAMVATHWRIYVLYTHTHSLTHSNVYVPTQTSAYNVLLLKYVSQ